MCRHPTGSRHFAAELDFMLLIAPTRQMRLQLSAPYGQPPICSRIGFYAPYCSYPTDAAAVVGTLRAAATLLPSWHFMLLIAPTRQVRQHVSAPYGQPPLCCRVGILCSLLLLPDRCGSMCRHPTGSRHFAAELAFYAPYCSYQTGAAACVGTLRAAATLLPSWHFMLLIAPTRQVRQHVSAPYGQPPLCCRVGILCSLLLLPDRCGSMCRHPTGSRHFAAELAIKRLGHFFSSQPPNGGCCFFYVVPSAPAIGC